MLIQLSVKGRAMYVNPDAIAYIRDIDDRMGVEIEYTSGKLSYLTGDEWATMKPLLVAGKPTEDQIDVTIQRLADELVQVQLEESMKTIHGLEHQLEDARARIEQLEQQIKLAQANQQLLDKERAKLRTTEEWIDDICTNGSQQFGDLDEANDEYQRKASSFFQLYDMYRKGGEISPQVDPVQPDPVTVHQVMELLPTAGSLGGELVEAAVSGEISPQADPVTVGQVVELIMSLPGATSEQPDPVTFEQVMEDGGEISPQPAPVPDHYKRVVEVKRRTFDSKTSRSKRTMWTCFTDDGLTFNLFDHADPLRDDKPLLEEAGYLSFFQLMPEGGVNLWKQNPIRVAITPDGKFWQVEAIAPRQPDAVPDEIDESSLTLVQLLACRAAKMILDGKNVAIFDFETTGLESDCEIVEISVVNEEGEYVFTELVKPSNMANLRRPGKNGMSSFDIHGIDEQMLAGAASLKSPYMQQQFEKHLGGKVWAAFNAPFEERLLRQSWTLAGVEAPQPEPVRFVDVQALTDQFIGHKKTSVDEACRVLKLGPTDRHRAAGDAMDTYRILRAMADLVPGLPEANSTDIPF